MHLYLIKSIFSCAEEQVHFTIPICFKICETAICHQWLLGFYGFRLFIS